MKFVSKAPRTKTFWVEDFTEEDRVFFEAIGFKTTKPHASEMVAKAFGLKPTLNFTGSDIFGMWTKEEQFRITHEICERYKIGKFVIEQFDFYE